MTMTIPTMMRRTVPVWPMPVATAAWADPSEHATGKAADDAPGS